MASICKFAKTRKIKSGDNDSFWDAINCYGIIDKIYSEYLATTAYKQTQISYVIYAVRLYEIRSHQKNEKYLNSAAPIIQAKASPAQITCHAVKSVGAENCYLRITKKILSKMGSSLDL